MMPITTKGRYAARIMVCLARHGAGHPATKHEIGEAEGISANYVEQLMIHLRSADLVRSHRGRKGGFSLAREPSTISLLEVLRAVEGPVSPVPCLHEVCDRAAACPTQPVWRRTAEAIEKVLSEITIGRMAADAEARQVADPVAYQI